MTATALNKTIDTYFKLSAKELGYEFISDSSAILWKLDYSYTSGVRFDGTLSLHSTGRLLARIAPDVDSSRVNISFIHMSTDHFTPEHMRVLLQPNDDEDTLDDFPVKRVTALIHTDVRCVVSRLTQDGYALMDACNPTDQIIKGSKEWKRLSDGSVGRRFSCGDIAVEVIVRQTDDFEGYWSGSDKDDHVALTHIIARRKVFAYDLKVRVFVKSKIYFDEIFNEIPVFENSVNGVWKKDGGLHPLHAALILLDSARSTFSDIGKTLVRLGR